jgi:hypothetical protein
MNEPLVFDDRLKLIAAQLLQRMAAIALAIIALVVGLALYAIIKSGQLDGLPVVAVVGVVALSIAAGALWGATDYIRKARKP